MEIKLLASIALDREAYNLVEEHLSSKDFSPLGAEILKEIIRFYENDASVEQADIDIVFDRVSRKLRNKNFNDQLSELKKDIEGAVVSPANIARELLDQKREQLGQDLAQAILTGNTAEQAELVSAYQQLLEAEDLSVKPTEEYIGVDVAELFKQHFDEASTIKLSPKSLQRRLGNLRRGHHVVVVALPETGKTLLSIHIAVGAAYHGRKVLYIGNEEPVADIVMRSVSCMSGMTIEDIGGDPDTAMAKAQKVGYENIVFAGLDPGSLADVRGLVKRYKPDVLVVDQIRHIKAQSENRTTQLEAVAQGIRNICREFQLVGISITQGADSARDKLVLDMGDVDSSNVGIPGACDVMLMMGSNDEYRRINARMLTLAKNKAGGYHGSWPINIVPKISRVIDHDKD